MSAAFTLFSFLIAITVLVGFHELGHFSVARLFRVTVLTFSIGFGRSILATRGGVNRTKFSIGMIPLGGYVKMLDHVDDVVPENRHGVFSSKPAWQKSLIVLAGPLANFVLTFVLFAIVFSFSSTALKPVLGEPRVQSELFASGLRGGETVLQINGRSVGSWSDLRWEMTRFNSGRFSLTVLRDGSNTPQTINLDFLEQGLPLNWDVIGISMPRIDLAPIVGRIERTGTAFESDLVVGDRIMRADKTPIRIWDDFVQLIKSKPGQTISVDVERDGQVVNISLLVGLNENSEGRIGVAPDPDGIMQEALINRDGITILGSIMKSLQRTSDLIGFTSRMILGLIIGDVGLNNLAGPLVIADQAGETAELGLAAFLSFLAVLSVSLGLINLFPLPPLDGGHLVFHLYELFLGKKLPETVIVKAQHIGVVFLTGLMVFVIANDVLRNFGD
ncbi:MAG: RIP metalloprotease RseP [Proteobacteria bacterium]|nr:RIP metalloprotease RseP [Pseudomonadota bacterium]MDA1331903.1 RIP metalloprotease RseP [Pseudomonadota bacterium]